MKWGLTLSFCLLLVASLAHADDESTVSVVSYGFLDADQAIEQAKLFLSPPGKVTANTRNNTLIVVDSPAVAQKIQEHFRDLPPPQNVSIQVQVLETNDSSDQVLGLPIHAGSAAENRTIQLSVLEGSHASIMVGEKVPRPEFFYQWFIAHGYVMEATVFDEVGTRLDVQPKLLGDEAQITLTPVISYFAGRRKHTIVVRELSTQVIAANGQTIEIGAAPESSEFNTYFYTNQHHRSLRFLLTPRW